MLAWQHESLVRERETEGEDRDYLQKCPADRRLSGNELLSCTRRIYRALGKAETGHIFVCEPPDGEHSGCVRIHVASRCQSLKATSPSGGGEASQRGSWKQEK